MSREQKDKTLDKSELSQIKGAVQDQQTGSVMHPGLGGAPEPGRDLEKERGQLPLKDVSSTNYSQEGQQYSQEPQKEVIPPGMDYTSVPRPEPSMERVNYDAIEEIAESIVSEKWGDLIKGFGDLKLWKEKIDVDLSGVKQEIVRMQRRFEGLQNSVTGKVSEYGEGIMEINSEIKALERVLEKIINPLTTNIKELQKVTDRLKK